MDKKHSVTWIMIILNITAYLAPFMFSSLNLAIPSIGIELSGGQHILNWVVAINTLVVGSLIIPFGRFGDIIGRRKVFISGVLIFFISTLACGLAPSMGLLIFLRVIQAVGISMIFATTMAIYTAVVPPEQRGRAIGINVAVVYLGNSTGPALGGLICFYTNWRWIFFFAAAIAFSMLILSIFKLKDEWKGKDGERMDIAGSILCVSGLALFLYGSGNLTVSWIFYIYAVLGLLLLICFVLIETRVHDPLIPITVFTENKVFAFSNLATLIYYSTVFAMPFILSLYLQNVLRIDIKLSGFIILCQPAVMTVLSPIVGRLSDRVEPRILSSTGMAINTLGMLMFSFLTIQTPIYLIIANLIFVGIGYAFFSSPNTSAIMGSVETHQLGIASSLFSTSRVLGQSVSMVIVTLVTFHFLGSMTMDSQGYAPLFMISLRIIFIIFAILNLPGIFFSLSRGNIRSGENASLSA